MNNQEQLDKVDIAIQVAQDRVISQVYIPSSLHQLVDRENTEAKRED